MGVTAEEAARELLDVVPGVMSAIREEMRQGRDSDLSVAQFRTLNYIESNPGASLSDVADYIGLALPSMSKLVDGLVERKLVSRETCTGDRRRVNLDLTPRGRMTLSRARHLTRAYLADQLAGLSEGERETILSAMEALKELFAFERQGEGSRTHETKAA